MIRAELKRWFSSPFSIEILIFSLSLIVKLIASYFLLRHNGLALISEGDAGGYLDIAKSVASGEGFRMGGILSAWRTPLYPLFLSFFYFFHISLVFIPIIQIILLSIGSVLLYRTGSLLFSKNTGLIAAILFSFEPLLIVYDNMALSESFFVFLLIFSLYTLVKYFSDTKSLSPLILSSILIGAATLTRPIAMYFPILAIILFLIKNRLDAKKPADMFRPIIIYCLFFILTILPWSLRNQAVFGTFSLTNQGANEIYMERVPIVIAANENIDYNSAFIENQNNLEKSIPNLDRTLLGNTFKYNDFLAGESIRILRQNIPAVIKFHLIAAVSYFHTTGYDYVLHYFGIQNTATITNFTNLIFQHQWKNLFLSILRADLYNVVRIVGYLLWLVINLSVLASLFHDLKTSRKNLFAFLLLIGIILYFSALSIGPHTQARYRIPTYPMLFILIGFATTSIYSRIKIYLKNRRQNDLK